LQRRGDRVDSADPRRPATPLGGCAPPAQRRRISMHNGQLRRKRTRPPGRSGVWPFSCSAPTIFFPVPLSATPGTLSMNVNHQVTLLDRLRESELLEGDQLGGLEQLPQARAADPRGLMQVLLQRGLLTRFQLTLVVRGKGRELQLGPFVLLDKL